MDIYMDTIAKIKKVEENAKISITEASKEAQEKIIKTNKQNEEKLHNLETTLKDEVNSLIKDGKKQAIDIKQEEEKKRIIILSTLDKSIKEKMNQAVHFVLKEINLWL